MNVFARAFSTTAGRWVRIASMALAALQATQAGRRMLERVPLSRFDRATGATCDPVRAYVRRFSAEVRAVA